MIVELGMWTAFYFIGRRYSRQKAKTKIAAKAANPLPLASGEKNAIGSASVPINTEPTSQPKKQISIFLTNKAINKQLKLLAPNLALGALSQYVSASFTPLFLSTLVYQCFPMLRRAEKEVIEEKRPGFYAMVAVIQGMGVATGLYFAISLNLVMYFLGEKVVLKSRQRSEKLLVDSFQGMSDTVWCVREGVEIQMGLSDVQVDDIVVVGIGEVVPIDGLVVEGGGAVDQRSLTGESQPAEKAVGDRVFATTTVIAGRILIKTEKAGSDTTAAKIDAILKESVSFKSLAQQRGERWAEKGIPAFFGLFAIAVPLVGPTAGMVILSSHFGARIRFLAPLEH